MAALPCPPRSAPAGHQSTPPEEVEAVGEASLTKPAVLGLPFASWTLDWLAADLNEEQAIPLKRRRIGELPIAAGLRWREDETWFSERPDPAFAEKPGAIVALYEAPSVVRRDAPLRPNQRRSPISAFFVGLCPFSPSDHHEAAALAMTSSALSRGPTPASSPWLPVDKAVSSRRI